MAEASAPSPQVVVAGSSNTDLVVRVRAIPRPGETVLGGDLLRAQGGKGANQAVAAARAGAAVSFIACLGDDAFGDAALASLRAEGIVVSAVRRVPATPSGVALITVAADGQNSIVVAPGANERLSVADIERAAPLLTAARVVVAQLEVPLESVARALTLARAAGVATVLNPAPAQPLPATVLSQVDVLVCNESEAELLTTLPVTDGSSAEAAARALLARGPRAAILTRGADGYVLLDFQGAQHMPAFTVQVVDTTAAGDAFIGALACRMAAGDTLATAARHGAAAAALSVGRSGAQPSLPHADDIAAFLRQRA